MSNKSIPFPYKLYQLLETLCSVTSLSNSRLSSDEAAAASIAWLPHGRAFIIRDQAVFASKVLPVHFENIKYRSFLRQLNLWGFQRTCQHCVPYGRIHMGPDLGGWYHHHFLRGKPSDLVLIKRTPIKGNVVNGGKADVEMTPQFYDMPPIKMDVPDAPKWFLENGTSLGESGAASFPAQENVSSQAKGPGNNDEGNAIHHIANPIVGLLHQGLNTYYRRSLSQNWYMYSLQMASPFATQTIAVATAANSSPNLAVTDPAIATRRSTWHAGTLSELDDTLDSNTNLYQLVEEMESRLDHIVPIESEECAEADSLQNDALWSPSILSNLIDTLNNNDPIELTQKVPSVSEPDHEVDAFAHFISRTLPLSAGLDDENQAW
ncbi:hypothetical protein ACHAWO_013617 [Cyclotella atomus]|uniref:HSF-type DNA-binding domain-containing protein n=1 Tax=Cyclotella atomus TaxID=382360 RepID=A0ABD3PTZ8_9STRA